MEFEWQLWHPEYLTYSWLKIPLFFFARPHRHLSIVPYYTDTHKHRGRLLILKNQARGLVGTYAMNTTWP